MGLSLAAERIAHSSAHDYWQVQADSCIRLKVRALASIQLLHKVNRRVRIRSQGFDR
jgi:hypothetical protein